MENQTTQDLNQTPTVSPVDQTPSFQTPPVSNPINPPAGGPKSKLPILIIGIILFLLIAGSAAGFYVYKQQSLKTVTKPTSTPSPSNTLIREETPSATISPTIYRPTNAPTPIPDVKPQDNTLYLTSYQGKQAIFYTNTEEQRVFNSNSVETRDEYMGELRRIDGIGSEINYKTLVNPRRLFTVPERIIGLNFALNNTGENIYAAVITPKKVTNIYPGIDQTIYKHNLISNIYQQVWIHEVGSKKYPNANGIVSIQQVVGDKYLILSLFDCYACEPTQTGIIVANSITGKEIYLEDIGDVQIKQKDNVFTYKKLAPFKEPCEPGFGCDDAGQRTVYKPSGDTLISKLP